MMHEAQRPVREESFSVLDDHLIRSVVPARGKPYEHRCPKWAYENVAHTAAEFGDKGFTLTDLVEWAAVNWTQAAVALAFLKERSCVVTRFKRNYAASDDVHLDAMTDGMRCGRGRHEARRSRWASSETSCSRLSSP